MEETRLEHGGTSRPRFAMLGVAGFVAKRHLAAIKAAGGSLIAASDPNDSAGILDSFFPDAEFFTEFERFDRYLDKRKRAGNGPDFLTVCSPNYLHDAHARYGLRCGADVICEKPLVLNPWNLDGLEQLESETNQRVFTILQLRHHPKIRDLVARVRSSNRSDFAVSLDYISARGRWYHSSWKGVESKSGGIGTNIGIHLFDMLIMVFGPVRDVSLYLREPDRMAGVLHCDRASIKWFLSIKESDLPETISGHARTYRSMKIDGEEFDFTKGFEDLHDESYLAILDGRGFGIDEVRPSVELVAHLRSCKLSVPSEMPSSWRIGK